MLVHGYSRLPHDELGFTRPLLVGEAVEEVVARRAGFMGLGVGGAGVEEADELGVLVEMR
jgi:hypothetical protein